MLIFVVICAYLSFAEGVHEPAAATAPIYVSFTRWENRTFSPRVYYYVLLNQRANPKPDQSKSPAPPAPFSPTSPPNNNVGATDLNTPYTYEDPHAVQDKDEDEEALNPNDLDFLSIRLNTPQRPSKGKNRSKAPLAVAQSIRFPGTEHEKTPPAVPTAAAPPEFASQFGGRLSGSGPPPPPAPSDERHFSFPTTPLVLSPNTTSDKKKVAGQNETLLESTTGVEFYLKSDRDECEGFASRRINGRSCSTTNAAAASRPSTPSIDGVEIDTYGLYFDITRALRDEWGSNNALISPFSFLNIMAVLLLGANGTTFGELTHRLRPSNPDAIARNEFAYHASFQRLLRVLNADSGENVALEIFNGVFVDSSYPIRPAFTRAARELYGARTDNFDFGRDGEEVKNKINKLVAFKTRDKIKTVLDGPVDPSTTLALVNTIYFRGSWEKPFHPGITKRRPFYVHANATSSGGRGSDGIMQLDMMMNILSVPYLETPNFRVVGLPYKGNKTGFFILLPTRQGIEGLQEMEARLTVQDFEAMLTSMKETQVAIQLPKMRVEGADAEAKQLFERLGLGSLFDTRTADLGRISDTPGLYIKSVVHKAVLDLDESGTEAAAVSVATGDRTIDDNPPVQFTVNRPFAFCILHVQAKTMLFMGRVTRPVPLPAGSGPVVAPSGFSDRQQRGGRTRA